jgi:4-hydroxysphinganine ceramide fatty acyl 2-hydroxylase
MLTADTSRAAETARALRVKRQNAIVAALTGGVLIAISFRLYSLVFQPATFVLGFLAAILYANAFEYVLHRFLLHWGEGYLVRQHAFHHDTVGMPNEARYVNFATSAWVVVLLFVVNSPLVFLLERLLHLGLAPGMFAGFTLYYILYEEIHWRIHFGGWLPRFLRFARRHHMLHHGEFKGRYNVFLPLFDWLFERHEWKQNAGVMSPAERK